MGRKVTSDSITVSANTKSTGAIDIGDSSRIALIAKVTGAGTARIVVQGSIQSRLATDSLWVDTALEGTALTDGSYGQMGPASGDGTVFAAWPFYRVQVSSTGANVVDFVLTGLE